MGAPGYGIPRSLAPLSSASPAASSSVSARVAIFPSSPISKSTVLPPETVSPMCGSSSSKFLRKFAGSFACIGINGEYACPRKWLTPISGFFNNIASAAAAATPIARQFGSPGPLVAAILSTPGKYSDSEIFFIRAGSFFRCSELARSGTTPPYSACRSICE